MTTKTKILACVLLVSGCDLYLGGDDDCQPYPSGGNEPGAIAVPAQELRDPYTGGCVYQNYPPYDPNGCYQNTGRAEDQAAPVEYYDYAQCYGVCEGLDETTCLASDSCRAIYGCRNVAADGTCAETAVFAGCWGTAPSGPVFGTPCTGLDALECSRHNDCSAVHQALESCTATSCTNVLSGFMSCIAEGAPPPPPPPPPPACETLGERDCIARDDCTPLYEGSDCTCDDTGCLCAVWTFVACSI
jgi:hypothetical protein